VVPPHNKPRPKLSLLRLVYARLYFRSELESRRVRLIFPAGTTIRIRSDGPVPALDVKCDGSKDGRMSTTIEKHLRFP
jgi:hypothetical protein